MNTYRITITSPTTVQTLDALARSSIDALLSILEHLPAGARVVVRPA